MIDTRGESREKIEDPEEKLVWGNNWSNHIPFGKKPRRVAICPRHRGLLISVVAKISRGKKPETKPRRFVVAEKAQSRVICLDYTVYIYIYISSLFHPVSLFQRWLELLVASCFTPPFLSSNLLEEQRNTQIFILNNLHFFPLTFLTQISNPLFVKDFSHNLAYIYIYI